MRTNYGICSINLIFTTSTSAVLLLLLLVPLSLSLSVGLQSILMNKNQVHCHAVRTLNQTACSVQT